MKSNLESFIELLIKKSTDSKKIKFTVTINEKANQILQSMAKQLSVKKTRLASDLLELTLIDIEEDTARIHVQDKIKKYGFMLESVGDIKELSIEEKNELLDKLHKMEEDIINSIIDTSEILGRDINKELGSL